MIIINKHVAHLYPWPAAQSWAKRSKMLAALIPEDCSVLDFGGGMGHLYQFLKRRNQNGYVSLDYRLWTNKTVYADFNANIFPILPDRGDRFLVCQGLIEYLDRPVEFLQKIKQYGDTLAITYNQTPNVKIPRKNLFTFENFEDLLNVQGWRIIGRGLVVQESNNLPFEKLYLCTTQKI